MFFRLILAPIGIVSAFSGFVLFMVFNLIGKRGVLSALLGGFLGALGFFMAWSLISSLLLMLFSADEINRIFFQKPELGAARKTATPPSPHPTMELRVEDDEDSLTVSDLYSGPQQASSPEQMQESINFESKWVAPKETHAKVDAQGHFNLESNTRSVRTNVKEAALAARKVLMDDK